MWYAIIYPIRDYTNPEFLEIILIMIKIDSIKLYLERELSQKRYNHSIGVADEAVRLAKRYSVDTDKAYIAGLVHDCAKEVHNSEALKLLSDKYDVLIDDVAMHTHKILHGPLGACIARDLFEIDDAEILDAIEFHTTGKADMSMLTKIIYIADYIEPNRNFEGVDELRHLSYKDINQAIVKGIDFTISELVEKGMLLHPDTIHARNYLIMQNNQ